VPVSLVVSGVLTPANAFKDFANQWTLIFMFMFMMGEALFRTGFADKIGRWAVAKGKGRENLVLLNIMIVAAALSSVLSNTGTTVCFLPIVLGVVTLAGFSSRSFMMALAFATSFGGTITLIGTPPNGVVNGVLGTAGMPTFGFFEFALIGIPIAVVGIATFMLFGTRFLPKGKVDQTSADYSGPEALGDFKFRTNKMGLAVGTFTFVVAIMALGDFVPFIKKTLHIELLTAAALGAALVIIFKCITWKEAWQSVSWQTIFLFACMFPVSTALEKTGGVLMIASAVNDVVAGSPMGLMIGMTVLTATLTQFASNTATALIVGPIGLASAIGMGVNPQPILMGIGMGASLCFLTPIATPPNTIVLGPGQLKFIDYVKAGFIPQIVCTILVILLVPLIWPFH
jgi:sodium-dependent dicarboxylate transporter 2/3/5